MKKRIWIMIPVLLVILAALLVYLSPLRRSLEVRLDIWSTELRALLQPIGPAPTVRPPLPTPVVTTIVYHPTPTPTAQLQVSPMLPTETSVIETPQASPTPLPLEVHLPSPKFEAQDWNNCGPDTLALYLRYYGWDGNQFSISDQVKPVRSDRNVNIDELAGYVQQNVNTLKVEYRVGGSLDMLHQLIAAQIPVMIEETFVFEAPFWYQDDLWGGHYLLLTGYNNSAHTFLTQDSYYGADQYLDERKLDQNWQAFNRVYLLVYPPEKEDTLKAILSGNWDMDQNRRNALEFAQRETRTDPTNPFTWFNLGSNLVYFERYDEAIQAYDQARSLKIPQRMLRYQFGPFLAYFQGGRIDDLMALTDYALKITPNSEEALLWKGWGLYRSGRKTEALASFAKALETRPDYADAKYAIDYVKKN